MKVQLIQATPKPQKLITDIASICYGQEEAKNPDKLLRHLYELGHHSTLEHIYFTFKIEGISRSCLAQLVRHRHTSPTIESQRYTEQVDRKAIVPPTIQGDKVALELFEELIRSTRTAYQELRKLGIPREDARYVLPVANETREYLSMNLRELLHINKLRTSKQAQWEVRDLVNEMTMLVIENSPELEFMFSKEV